MPLQHRMRGGWDLFPKNNKEKDASTGLGDLVFSVKKEQQLGESSVGYTGNISDSEYTLNVIFRKEEDEQPGREPHSKCEVVLLKDKVKVHSTSHVNLSSKSLVWAKAAHFPESFQVTLALTEHTVNKKDKPVVVVSYMIMSTTLKTEVNKYKCTYTSTQGMSVHDNEIIIPCTFNPNKPEPKIPQELNVPTVIQLEAQFVSNRVTGWVVHVGNVKLRSEMQQLTDFINKHNPDNLTSVMEKATVKVTVEYTFAACGVGEPPVYSYKDVLVGTQLYKPVFSFGEGEAFIGGGGNNIVFFMG